MYRIEVKTVDGTEERLAVSRSYQLAKRTARAKVVKDMRMFMGTLLMYQNENLIERGSIVNTRISWEKANAEEETLQDSAGSEPD